MSGVGHVNSSLLEAGRNVITCHCGWDFSSVANVSQNRNSHISSDFSNFVIPLSPCPFSTRLKFSPHCAGILFLYTHMASWGNFLFSIVTLLGIPPLPTVWGVCPLSQMTFFISPVRINLVLLICFDSTLDPPRRIPVKNHEQNAQQNAYLNADVLYTSAVWKGKSIAWVLKSGCIIGQSKITCFMS